MSLERANNAVLREAIDRADYAANALERLVQTQQQLIDLQRQRIGELESQLKEWRCA